ncbi:helix-turn-helix transcriptional regulator [Streptomyces albus]|nr:LuxR family transcriptional regulator [Streptomyces sp. NRRL F-5639]
MTPFAEQKLPPHLLVPGFDTWREESGLIFVRGARYAGKTTLLNALGERAAESGALVLWATGWPGEHGLPHGVVRQFLETPEETNGHPDEVFAHAGPGPQDADGTPPGAAFPERAYRRLLDLAGRRPVLLAVDDLNYVDAPSQHFLRYLARRLKGTRIRLVLAERTGQAVSYCEDFRTDVMRLPYTRTVRLRPLTADQLTAWIGEQIRAVPGPPVRTAARRIAVAVHELSGGNVQLAGLLTAKYLAAAGRGGTAPAVDAEFRETVRAMVDDIDVPGVSRGARAAAVLGRFCSARRLGRLLRGDTVLADRVLRALDDLGMLRGPQVRQHAARALVEDPDFAGLPDVHLAAARVLFEDGVPVEHVARHLRAAGRIGRPWDPPLVLEVAHRALEEGRTEAAGTLLRLARTAAGTEEDRARAEILLLRSEWLADPPLVASLVPSLTAAARNNVLPAADIAFLVRALTVHGFPDRAEELLPALRTADRKPQEEAEVLLAEALHGVWQGVPPHRVPPGPHRPPARDDTSRRLLTGPYAWLPTVLHRIPRLLHAGDRQGVVFAAEQLLEGIRVKSSGVEPFLFACWALEAVNALPQARKRCLELAGEFDGRPSPVWTSLLAAVQARIAFASGDLDGAHRRLGQALAHKSWQEWGAKAGALAGLLVEVLTERGRHEEAADVLDRPVPPAAFRGLNGVRYVRARGRHHLAAGRLHAAVADFENCRDTLAVLDTDLPAVVPWRCDLAEAYLRMGDTAGARHLLEEQLGELPAEETAAEGVALRLLAAAGPAERRIPGLKLSAEKLERAGSRLQLAYTLAELASAYREAARLSLARTTIKRAQRLAQQCDAGRLGQLLALHGSPVAPHDDVPLADHTELAKLSSAERRVALLAIRGHTNREISTRLFITPSTVEQHLTRIYRKLRVRHREDLEDRFSSALVGLDALT